jgi:hypothetical protein
MPGIGTSYYLLVLSTLAAAALLGEHLLQANAPYVEYSVLAASARLNVPFSLNSKTVYGIQI